MTSANKYYKEIDSLRALAVVAVIVNHLNKNWLSGGFLGVDIFFVLSGFVVIASLQDKVNSSFKDFVKGFYARRIKRLWPLLVITVLIFLVPTYIFFYKPEVYVKTGFYSLLGFSNIYLFSNAFDYFSTNTETNPFTHTWSLGVEEQFYLVLPILFYFGCKFKKFSRLLLGISVLSLISFLYLNQENPLMSFYMMPTRFWQFSLGIFAFIVTTPKFIQRISKHAIILPLLGVSSIIILTEQFNSLSAVMVSFLMFVILLFIKSTPERSYLTFRPVLKIGLLSYSLYLFHWPVIVFFREVMSLEGSDLLVAILLIIFLSYLCNILIEERMRHLKWGRSYYIACLCLIIVVHGIKDQRVMISDKLLINGDKISFSVWGKGNYSKKLNKCYSVEEDNLGIQSLDDFKKFMNDCEIINEGEKRIYFFGNSHAIGRIETIMNFSKKYNYKLNLFAQGGIKIYPYEVNHGLGREISQKLTNYFFDSAYDNLQSGDLVVLSTPLYHFINSEVFADKNSNFISNQQALEIFSKFLIQQKEILEKKGIDLILVAGEPILDNDISPSNCIKTKYFETKKCKYPFIVDQEISSKVESVDTFLQGTLEGSYISLFSFMFSKLKSEEKPWLLYYNKDHLSSYGDKTTYDYIERELLESLDR